MSAYNSTNTFQELLQYTPTAELAELDTEYDPSQNYGQIPYSVVSTQQSTLGESELLYTAQPPYPTFGITTSYASSYSFFSPSPSLSPSPSPSLSLSSSPASVPETLSDSVSILHDLTTFSSPNTDLQSIPSPVSDQTGAFETSTTYDPDKLSTLGVESTTSLSKNSDVFFSSQPLTETHTHPVYNGTFPYVLGGGVFSWHSLGETSSFSPLLASSTSYSSHTRGLPSLTSTSTPHLGETESVSYRASLSSSSSIPVSTLILTLVSTSTMSTNEPKSTWDSDEYGSTSGGSVSPTHTVTDYSNSDSDDDDDDDDDDHSSKLHSETASIITKTLFHTSTTSATAHYSYSTDKSHKYFIFDQTYDFTDATTSFTTGIPTTLTIPRDSPTYTFSVPTSIITRPASLYQNWLDTGSLNLPTSKYKAHRVSNQAVIGSVVGSIVGALCISALICILIFLARRRRHKGSDDQKEDDPFQNEFVFRDRAATNANLIGHPGLNSSGEFGDIHGYGNTDTPSKDMQTLGTEPLSYSRSINNGIYETTNGNQLRNSSLRSDMRTYYSRSYSEYDSPISEFSYEFASDDDDHSGHRANALHNTDSFMRNDQSLFREVI